MPALLRNCKFFLAVLDRQKLNDSYFFKTGQVYRVGGPGGL